MWSLESERLYIQQLSFVDAPFILELLNTEGWLKHIGDRGVKTVKDAEGYISSGPQEGYKKMGHGLMLLREKYSNQSVGICGLLQRDYLDHPDIGYALLPAFEKKGFVSEACRSIIDWHKEHSGIRSVCAIVNQDNERSIKLLINLDFVFTEVINRDGQSLNLYQYDL